MSSSMQSEEKKEDLSKSAVLIAGCNPALQKTLFFDTFEAGSVNRVTKLEISIGGKGQIASRAIDSWNKVRSNNHTTAFLLQFLGGNNGKELISQIEKYKSTIQQLTIDISPQNTRIATTLCVTNGGSDDISSSTIDGTEIVEPSPQLTPNHQSSFLSKLQNCVSKQSNIKCFAICGTTPSVVASDNNGGLTNAEFYFEMIQSLKKSNDKCLVIMDAYKHISKVMNSAEPILDILKINVTELAQLCGYDLRNKSENRHRNSVIIDDIVVGTYRQKLNSKIPHLILTDGGDVSYYFDFAQKCVYMYALPQMNVLNAIGCGDTCTAVIASVISQCVDNKEWKCEWTDSVIAYALKWGLSAACAATQTVTGGDFDAKLTQNIFEKIKVSQKSL